MNEIDYSQIDELCKNLIHTCNEKLGMTTLFCCQGSSRDDDNSEHHSECPYVMFLESDRTLKILKELIKSRVNGVRVNRLKLYYSPFRSVDRWTLRYESSFSLKLRKTQLKKFWDDLESDLIKLSSKIR